MADWQREVCAQFPVQAELTIPWRWRNAGTEALGAWLLEARRQLAGGGTVDLRTGPQGLVTWVPVVPPNEHAQRLIAARTPSPVRDGRVLILADSHNRQAQQQIACQTPGASTVEAVDLQDLTSFGRTFDVGSPQALSNLLAFGQSVMANLGVAELMRRLETLRAGRARTAATVAETAALAFVAGPSLATAATLLEGLRAQPDARVYRPTILFGALRAMREASQDGSFSEAATRVREEGRLLGRALPRRAVGSTLLLKGLEAEVAVVLNPAPMSAAHLYVAMTRGSMHLVVCSPHPTVGA